MIWSDQVAVFDPIREGAYGSHMHDPGRDPINPDLPPAQPPGQDNKGWAYGAFILDRYTTWNGASRVLDLYYLLSLSSPYQVQLMHSALRLPDLVDMMQGFTSAAADQLDYEITFAEARHNLIARLIDDHRPDDALALAADTIAGYKRYAALPGADVMRLGQDLVELTKQLIGAGQPPPAAVDAQQAVIDMLQGHTPPAASQLAYEIMLVEARHNLIARLIDDHRPQEATALADETISGYKAYAASPGADLARVSRDLGELTTQLQGIGDTAHATEARQAANDLTPPG